MGQQVADDFVRNAHAAARRFAAQVNGAFFVAERLDLIDQSPGEARLEVLAQRQLRGRRIATQVQRQALSILVISGAAVSLGLLVIIPLADHLPLDKLMFEVVSAFATVGLSTGITADLPPAAQGVIIALMYAGRVGVVTLALALAINQVPRAYRYPEEKPIVG